MHNHGKTISFEPNEVFILLLLWTFLNLIWKHGKELGWWFQEI